MQCKGTAWAQVKSLDATTLTDPVNGVKALLLALSSWDEAAELQTYEKFEKALFRVQQRSDETTMSYVNRLAVAFNEIGGELTIKEVKAFIMLKQSALSSEDKRKVITLAGGSIHPWWDRSWGGVPRSRCTSLRLSLFLGWPLHRWQHSSSQDCPSDWLPFPLFRDGGESGSATNLNQALLLVTNLACLKTTVFSFSTAATRKSGGGHATMAQLIRKALPRKSLPPALLSLRISRHVGGSTSCKSQYKCMYVCMHVLIHLSK